MLAFSCHIDDEPELQEQEDRLEIVSASSEAKDLFNEWIGKSNPNARTIPQFSTRDMVQINRSGMTRYVAPKIGDPNISISFVIDRNRNIDKSFISTSVINRDQTVTSKMYSIDNRLIATFVHNPDGTLKGSPTVHGFWEWWDEVDHCIGHYSMPYDSNLANILFDLGLSIASRGAWLPFIATYCLGEGTGKYYEL